MMVRMAWRVLGGAALAVAVMSAGASVAAPAKTQAAKAVNPMRAKLAGTWMGLGGQVDPRFVPTNFRNPEFTPWGKQESDRVSTPNNPGECDIYNPVSFMVTGGIFPIQILDTGKTLVMYDEAVIQPRRVFMDGRGHPPKDELDATWLGHSVGTWEGDTLVVDTIGLNGRERPLNGYVANGVTSGPRSDPRIPSTTTSHIVERFRMVVPDILEDVITVDDPKVLLKPISEVRYFQRRNDLDVLEYPCTENYRPEDEGQLR